MGCSQPHGRLGHPRYDFELVDRWWMLLSGINGYTVLLAHNLHSGQAPEAINLSAQKMLWVHLHLAQEIACQTVLEDHHTVDLLSTAFIR